MKCLLDAFVWVQGVFMHLSVQGAPRPSSRQQRVTFEQERDFVQSGAPGKNIQYTYCK